MRETAVWQTGFDHGVSHATRERSPRLFSSVREVLPARKRAVGVVDAEDRAAPARGLST